MTHRLLSDIDTDIAAAASRLSGLHVERRAAERAEHDVMLRFFDAGLSAPEISRTLGANKSTVQGVLWRHGRSVKGRTAIRQRIDAHVGTPQGPA